MTYILLIVLTYLLMAANGRLLGIPGFFYYSSVRLWLRLYFGEKLALVEKVYFWEMMDMLGRMAQLSILPAYIITFDLFPLHSRWMEAGVFLWLNYVWWMVYAVRMVRLFIPQIPELGPRPARMQETS
jgi:hypothetical protein